MVSLSLENLTLPDTENYSVPYPIRQFSVEEYEELARHGILDEDDNVELLEGWLVPKMTKNPLHAAVLTQLQSSLSSRLSSQYHLRVQCAIKTIDSTPEPDLTIVRGTPLEYVSRHPQVEDISLVIEVAESSLARDRKKRRVYARAGIAQFWIVNLVEMCVEVYGDPTGLDDAHYQTGIKCTNQETLESDCGNGIGILIPVNEFLRIP